jgi:hypothetical protein
MRLRNPQVDNIVIAILFTFFLLVFLVGQGHAQTSTVSATITDSTAQAISNGTWKAEYIRPSGIGSGTIPVRRDTGVPLTSAELTVSGGLDITGFFTTTLTRTDFIAPGGGSWKFTICPLSTSGCFLYGTAITTGSVSLSTQLTTAARTISVIAGGNLFAVAPRAYNNTEMSGYDYGSLYFDINSLRYKYWNGATWNDMGGLTGLIDVSSYNNDINAAIAACPTNGCTIWVGPGTYTVNSTINMNKDNVCLWGSGKGSPYAGNSGATTLNVAAGITGIDITGARNCVKDMFLYSASVWGWNR